MLRGDRVHLSQVLINLVMNGMDAVAELPPEDRQVTLRSRLDGAVVEISVSDSGTGIAPDVIAKVFEPFYTTKPNGMGMGLSVSRTIIDAHGGRMWAENAPSGGAVFKVLLPVFGSGQDLG
jgi:C4-dicarboxylate-specific signal transduction histidine kinase